MHPNRERFQSSWPPIILFLVLETLLTFWFLVSPRTDAQAAIGTGVASAVIGLIALGFLRYEGVRARDVGLGGRAWLWGVILFVVWWAVVTGIDWAGRGVASLLGRPLPTAGSYEWSLVTLLQLISKILVGFGEEMAWRAYLHNKYVAVIGRRWLAILLAALTFGLWHTPADIFMQGSALGPLANAGFYALIGLVFFSLPYEWTGLLPFLALFHTWNDFLIDINMQAPTWVGVIAGYVLMWVALWAYKRLRGQTGGVVENAG
jgi:membrane protease YdiL (CAAX protease family)